MNFIRKGQILSSQKEQLFTMNRYTPGSEKNIDTKLLLMAKSTKEQDFRKESPALIERAKSPEVGDIVLATCSSIFTAAIYGKLVPEVKIKWLESLSPKNAINSTRRSD